MNFAENPDYKIAFTTDNGINLYMPNDLVNGYHISRKIASEAQNIYSSGGATKEVLEGIMNKILDEVNNEKSRNDRIRSNISILANNILYRLKYPLDENCAIRMGAIFTFLDGEDPDKVDPFWTEKKVKLAHNDPDAYAFFLTIGTALTPSYKESQQYLSDPDYFKTRTGMLKSLIPQKA